MHFVNFGDTRPAQVAKLLLSQDVHGTLIAHSAVSTGGEHDVGNFIETNITVFIFGKLTFYLMSLIAIDFFLFNYLELSQMSLVLGFFASKLVEHLLPVG